MKMIPVGKSGLFSYVDDDDYIEMSRHKWSIAGDGYASCTSKEKRHSYMHRLITKPPAGKDVDHINGNKLDNRKKNLRVCTRSENLRNCRKRAGSSSFTGVSRFKGKWRAYIYKDSKQIHLGVFDEELSAFRAYEIAAKKYHGEYSFLERPAPCRQASDV